MTTTGHKQSRVSVIAKLWMDTGWKLRMRGYRSMGDRVPLVMTTLWNLLKMGRMAREASRQLQRQLVQGVSVLTLKIKGTGASQSQRMVGAL